MSSRVTPALTIALALALGPALPTGASDHLELPDNPLQGRLLFESKQCNRCHSVAGQRGDAIGPNLGEGRFSGSFLDLGAALWNHVPGMSVGFEDAGVAWPELTPGEVTELAAFLYFIDYLGRPGVAARGEALFEAKGCGLCHGLGDGTGSAPDLTTLERFASPLYIAQAIWNHGPSMLQSMRRRGIPPPELQAGDLADLSAFIRQVGSGGPRERVLLAPGNPNRGRELFESKGCAVCHGRSGGGAPDLAVSNLHRSADAIAGVMWNHADEMTATMSEVGLDWPSFTTTELADLVAYIYFLPFDDPPGDAERGTTVFAARSCDDCHNDRRDDEHTGPDLASGKLLASPAELVAAMWNHAPFMKEAILGEGLPWPELTGRDLRDLRAMLQREAAAGTGGD